MIVASFTTKKADMKATRTAEDFIKLVGMRPERMGIVSRMEPYANMTASFLTEGLGNVMRNGEKAGSKYQKINALMYEWEIEQNQIEYVYFAADAVGDGCNGSEITMAFRRRYYDLNDTFIIEGSKQMCIVMESPIRKADDFWEYSVRLMANDYATTLDADYCKAGMATRWIGNVQPEFHSVGYTKYQSNVELQRGWISETRVDIDASSRYMELEDNFVKVADDTDQRKMAFFKLPGMKKLLLDNFMAARNQSMLWQRGTMDENGKCMVTDRKGRPLVAGDGLIPQINRFASKVNYVKLTPSILNQMIVILTQKCANPTGNDFAFCVNSRLWYDLQTALAEFLQHHHSDNQFIWSKEGEKIKVGATYGAYCFSGNEIKFHLDRALDYEYPEQGYGILVDLTGDKASGRPAIEMFTLGNKQLIENELRGVGIENGPVATEVAGIHYTLSGYHGIAVYNPYRSVILVQSKLK